LSGWVGLVLPQVIVVAGNENYQFFEASNKNLGFGQSQKMFSYINYLFSLSFVKTVIFIAVTNIYHWDYSLGILLFP
jgi:hypothetical protein